MRSFHATHNLLAVSANAKETALNVEHALDTGMLCDLGSVFSFERRRESNADEAIGKEEPDSLYDLGALASLDLSFTKMQAQHAAFIMAFALGSISSAAAGATGYRHTIAPISGDLDASRSNPTFTSAMRYGKWLLKDRFAGCMIDSFTISLKKDSWASIRAAVKSTGKRSTTKLKDTIAGAYNAASLTLSTAIAGATAQERLDNVHHVRVQDPTTLEWKDVAVTAASDATPCILTITPAGGVATGTTYIAIFNTAETGGYSWGSFPSRIVEPPLRVSDFAVNLGGKWDGSALVGGHAMSSEIKNFEWAFQNNLTPEFVPGGGTYSYANRALREGRSQKISLDRDFKDYLIGQRADDTTDYFVFYMKAEGPEYEAGHKYTVELVFPRVGVLSAPVSLDGKRLGEKGDLVVLEDDTYGSVIAYVKNKVSAYAA